MTLYCVTVIALGTFFEILQRFEWNSLLLLALCWWWKRDSDLTLEVFLLLSFHFCHLSYYSTSLSNPPRTPCPPPSDPVGNTKWTICCKQLLQHPSWYFQGSIQEAHNFSRFSCLVENPCPEVLSTSNLHTYFFSPKVKLILALTPLTLLYLLLEPEYCQSLLSTISTKIIAALWAFFLRLSIKNPAL